MAYLLDLRVWMGIAIAVLVGLLGLQQVRVSNAKAQTAQVRLDLEKERSAAQSLARQAEADNRKIEQSWQAHANKIGETKNEEIQALNSRVESLTGELRNRPKRPSGGDVSKAPSTCQGATGAGIYAEDAGFLVGESARADRLRLALAACYSQYETLIR